MERQTFAIETLGCKVNQYEEQVLRENLLKNGFRESALQEADYFIVNSCTVTGRADSKTRKLIKRAKKENPGLEVYVTGCYAVLPEDIEKLRSMPEVRGVVPGGDKMTLPRVLSSVSAAAGVCEETHERISGFGSHTRAFLKIQDGCDRGCSYCKVNIVRGPSKSRCEGEVIDEVVRLAKSGYREIVLTGICLGSWKGKDGKTFTDLLRTIDKLEGDFRVRLSSIEPDQIGKELIETIARSRRICRHLHIPLQSGSDKVLKMMNRRYDTARFRELVLKLREKMPLIGITMDIIAGFPGETEEDFEKTAGMIEELRPSRLHVFKYSDRKGTKASGMKDKVPSDVAAERVGKLINIGSRFQSEFCGKFLGREAEILVEDRSIEGVLTGYTGEYIRAGVEGAAKIGELIRINIKEIDEKTPLVKASKR